MRPKAMSMRDGLHNLLYVIVSKHRRFMEHVVLGVEHAVQRKRVKMRVSHFSRTKPFPSSRNPHTPGVPFLHASAARALQSLSEPGLRPEAGLYLVKRKAWATLPLPGGEALTSAASGVGFASVGGLQVRLDDLDEPGEVDA
jgi:hypothetical protein